MHLRDQAWKTVTICLGVTALALAHFPPQSVAHEGHGKKVSKDSSTDPYAVPEGDEDALIDFIRTARERIQPKSFAETKKMFEVVEHAADHLIGDKSATATLRFEATIAKLESTAALIKLSDPEAKNRLEKFLDDGIANESGEIRELLQNVRIDRKLKTWNELDAKARDALTKELRTYISVDDVTWSRVRLVFRYAETVAETRDALRAVKLIEQVTPYLKKSKAPRVASEVEMLAGVARRLQLIGKPISLVGTTLEGKKLDWSHYEGKLVLIDYWATYCPPCLADMKRVQQLHDQYHDKGFEVVGVSLDEDKANVDNLVKKRALPWVNLIHTPKAGEAEMNPLAVQYGITTLPRAILVGPDGKVISTSANPEKLARELRSRFGNLSAASAETASDAVTAVKNP